MDRVNLVMTRDIASVWRTAIDNADRLVLREHTLCELEEMIRRSAVIEAGDGTKVELDRGFKSATVTGPGGIQVHITQEAW